MNLGITYIDQEMDWFSDLVSLTLFSLAFLVGLFIYDKFIPMVVEKDVIISYKKAKKHVNQNFFTMIGLTSNDALTFRPISDNYSSLTDVSRAVYRAGLDHCDLIIGIDFTASNEWQGRKTFNGENLHSRHGNKIYNPYQKVIAILGETLEPFAHEKKLIHAFGFGDLTTQAHSVFPLKSNWLPCQGFYEVLHYYNRAVQNTVLSGPTSFAPLIEKAIEIVKLKEEYHILVIIADGQMGMEQPSIDAIVTASHYALSIIMVGVGDGPWDMMEEFDDHLPQRKFDNFQFVNYHQTTRKAKNPEASFALHALMEIPAQYKAIQSLEYLFKSNTRNCEANTCI